MEKESGRIREGNWAGNNGSKWERLHEMAGQKKTACVFHRNDRRKCMTEAGRE